MRGYRRHWRSRVPEAKEAREEREEREEAFEGIPTTLEVEGTRGKGGEEGGV